MSEHVQVDHQQVRPFAAILVELNRGRTHTELSEALVRLVAAVQATGKKGSLTLTLSVGPTGAAGAVQLADKVTLTEPAFDRAASLFYVDEQNNLSRTDPQQLPLPLQEAEPLHASTPTPITSARERS